MKYLIFGLGNVGDKYEGTRHNVGFEIINNCADKYEGKFNSARYSDISEIKIRGKKIILIKPNTFMNLSGKAVRYWMQKEKIDTEKILIVLDDIALKFGRIKIKGKGSDGGHNGLKNINDLLKTNNYPRLRFGIGSEFNKGQQVNFVLGKWTEEKETIENKIKNATSVIESFVSQGLERTMNKFN